MLCHYGIVGIESWCAQSFLWGSNVVWIRLLCFKETQYAFVLLCLFSDSESSSTTGATETQPSGDYYGDSKDISTESEMHYKYLKY